MAEGIQRKIDKKRHGGKRANAGRKPDQYPIQLLKVKCIKEELEQILKLSTRERAEALIEKAT